MVTHIRRPEAFDQLWTCRGRGPAGTCWADAGVHVCRRVLTGAYNPENGIAELENTNYTGVGISCGGGLCNVCVSYLSIPVLSFSIPKAGDYIDSSAAAMTGERATRIRMMKEDTFHLNGYFTDKIQQAIGVYYDDMIHGLVSGMKEALKSARKMPKMNRPLPLVLSGGTTLPAGFRDRFEKIIGEEDFPLPVSEIRMAADPLHTSARGALVAAITDM